MCRRAVQIIPGLLRRVDKLETEVRKRKAKEFKMKLFVAATTWIVVAVLVFGNK